MRGSKLQKLLHVLKKHDHKNDVYNYAIPDLWNAWNYQGEEMVRTSWGNSSLIHTTSIVK